MILLDHLAVHIVVNTILDDYNVAVLDHLHSLLNSSFHTLEAFFSFIVPGLKVL